MSSLPHPNQPPTPPGRRSDGGPRVVIVGAGVVGSALADELTARGVLDVTVVDRGPLPATGGSSSHAPGLVFQTHPSRTMTAFAAYTVAKFRGLVDGGRSCFLDVGGLELATSHERLAELHRRAGLAASWGVRAEVVSPERCAELWPLLDTAAVLGGLHTPQDGLARAVPACRAQLARAEARGARLLERCAVVGVERTAGAVTGVATEQGHLPCDVLVCAAGLWGVQLGALAGVEVPLLPMAHQYARTPALPALARRADGSAVFAEASRPILRHQDYSLYFREHLAEGALGIGSYAHRPLPVDPQAPPAHSETTPNPSQLPFTRGLFAPSMRESAKLLPVLEGVEPRHGIDGILSFTPDGMPLLGEAPGVRGCWLAEAVWVTHSAGAARAVAEALVDGRSSLDLHECDPARFAAGELSPALVRERAVDEFRDVYAVRHPETPPDRHSPHTSPCHARHLELGADMGESDGRRTPRWYAVNAPRDEDTTWAGRHRSPAISAEANTVRTAAGLFDLSWRRRIEVTGPGAVPLLERSLTRRLPDTPGGSVRALFLDEAAGIRGDAHLAEVAPQRWLLTTRAPGIAELLSRGAEPGTHVAEMTGGCCRLGLWGPRAGEVLRSAGTVRRAGDRAADVRLVWIGRVPVTAVRSEEFGEPGWELHTDADLGPALWDTLRAAGRGLGLVPAGVAALGTLRLEAGVPEWGRELSAECLPSEAGLDRAVDPGHTGFTGLAALDGAAPPRRRLVRLALDDPDAAVLGGEPVRVAGAPAGHVTGAAFAPAAGRCLAFAWLPARAAVPETPVDVEYFGERLAATVLAEPGRPAGASGIASLADTPATSGAPG
ncbi:FAD-dependent oxidoreductase [Streptomyces xiaopingdaonensis]|uniref:FAD-dependent oxidoreductase n=1 Tax=Streptomyces xiaopingdaonensis TaxID=1565415 RepID=UPI0002EEA580|nr:FAD-dependent oxidoreductase [Streptomyces xiaopingdaonensis]